MTILLHTFQRNRAELDRRIWESKGPGESGPEEPPPPEVVAQAGAPAEGQKDAPVDAQAAPQAAQGNAASEYKAHINKLRKFDEVGKKTAIQEIKDFVDSINQAAEEILGGKSEEEFFKEFSKNPEKGIEGVEALFRKIINEEKLAQLLNEFRATTPEEETTFKSTYAQNGQLSFKDKQPTLRDFVIANNLIANNEVTVPLKEKVRLSYEYTAIWEGLKMFNTVFDDFKNPYSLEQISQAFTSTNPESLAMYEQLKEAAEKQEDNKNDVELETLINELKERSDLTREQRILIWSFEKKPTAREKKNFEAYFKKKASGVEIPKTTEDIKKLFASGTLNYRDGLICEAFINQAQADKVARETGKITEATEQKDFMGTIEDLIAKITEIIERLMGKIGDITGKKNAKESGPSASVLSPFGLVNGAKNAFAVTNDYSATHPSVDVQPSQPASDAYALYNGKVVKSDKTNNTLTMTIGDTQETIVYTHVSPILAVDANTTIKAGTSLGPLQTAGGKFLNIQYLAADGKTPKDPNALLTPGAAPSRSTQPAEEQAVPAVTTPAPAESPKTSPSQAKTPEAVPAKNPDEAYKKAVDAELEKLDNQTFDVSKSPLNFKLPYIDGTQVNTNTEVTIKDNILTIGTSTFKIELPQGANVNTIAFKGLLKDGTATVTGSVAFFSDSGTVELQILLDTLKDLRASPKTQKTFKLTDGKEIVFVPA